MFQPLFWSLGTVCATTTTLKDHMHASSTSEASLDITLCSELFSPNRRVLQVFSISLIFPRGEKCDLAQLITDNRGFCPTHPALDTVVVNWGQAAPCVWFSQICAEAVRDALKTKLKQMPKRFLQHHKNCQSEGGGANPDGSTKSWIFKGKTCGYPYLLRHIETNLTSWV